MVIMDKCDWCGGPHETVFNCEKAVWVKESREGVPPTEFERGFRAGYDEALKVARAVTNGTCK